MGCVYICYMDAKRAGVRDCVRLAAARHANVLDDPYPSLRTNDYFGVSLASLGRDGDGHLELLVGASGVDDGGARAGAAFLLTVDKDGSVLKHRKYSALTEPRLALRGGDHFGSSFAAAHAGASILLYGGADAARNGGQTGAGAVLAWPRSSSRRRTSTTAWRQRRPAYAAAWPSSSRSPDTQGDWASSATTSPF